MSFNILQYVITTLDCIFHFLINVKLDYHTHVNLLSMNIVL